jgi:hypothetical protein
MSMHLEGPGLTTTSTKKREVKVTKAQQEEIERSWRERNKRLKEMGLPKQSLEEFTDWLYGRGKKEKDRTRTSGPVVKTTFVREGQENIPASSIPALSSGTRHDSEQPVPKSLGLWITGPISSKPAPTYTGTKVLGIGTMHKSNMVPIFSDKEAVDISRMRR